MQCPRCNLHLQRESLVCECGYELWLTPEMQSIEVRKRSRARKLRIASAVFATLIVPPWAYYFYLRATELPSQFQGLGTDIELMIIVLPATAIFFVIAIVLFGLSRV